METMDDITVRLTHENQANEEKAERLQLLLEEQKGSHEEANLDLVFKMNLAETALTQKQTEFQKSLETQSKHALVQSEQILALQAQKELMTA